MNANLTAPAETVAELTDDRNDQVLTLVGDKTPCNCSDNCPQLTGRFFAQGHDARLVTRLRNAVVAGEISTAEAFAEITKRGGTERLQIKLDAAVANARSKPAKKARKGKKAKVTTFELDGFTLITPPVTTRQVAAKVGRWEYDGTLRTHRSGEEGATKDDTFMVFEFVNKAGELVETTNYKFVADIVPVAEVMDAVAAKMAEEVTEAPADEDETPINAFANRVATPAVPEVAASAENTDDIPF